MPPSVVPDKQTNANTRNTMQTIHIHKNYLLAASLVQSHDDKRLALNGVNLRTYAKRLVLSATDGRRLLAINLGEVEEDVDVTFCVPVALLHKQPLDYVPVEVHSETEDVKTRVILQIGDFKVEPSVIYGKFPEWRSVVSVAALMPQASVSFNLDYCGEMLDVLRLCNEASGSSLQVVAYMGERGAPMILTSEDGNALAMWMPMVSDAIKSKDKNNLPFSRPAWLAEVCAV